MGHCPTDSHLYANVLTVEGKCIKVQLKSITNVSTVNWGQGHQRIREMRIEGRLGVVREHGSVCMGGKLVHIDCNEVLCRVVAEEVVDVGKGAEAANAVKWLKGLEGKGTEGKG